MTGRHLKKSTRLLEMSGGERLRKKSYICEDTGGGESRLEMLTARDEPFLERSTRLLELLGGERLRKNRACEDIVI